MIDAHHGWNKSLKPVFLGFLLTLICTVSIYRIVVLDHLKHNTLLVALMGITIIGALLQLFFYLHLGLESKPRWNMMTFLFMVLVTIIIVGGSIWIMTNINYNAMTTN